MRNWAGLVFIVLGSTSASFADVTVRFEGVAGETVFQAKEKLSSDITVGDLSILVLEREAKLKRTTYQGSREGIRSIGELSSAMEVESDRIMRAYGWCFKVNGQIPMLYSHEIPLRLSVTEDNNAEIVWFYSYAYYDSGVWTKMCVPADHLPSEEDRDL
ncbi:MAG: hypothetical protein EOP09_13270 [Proteobacteria bacterium]|nr:MAG: hypothetical protein EOP09_13270 [Pseudomonadota bacterium]